MWAQVADALLVVLGGFLAVVGAMFHDSWKEKRDRSVALGDARTLIRKLVQHNEDMARRLINEMRQGNRDDSIYFMLSAWKAIQIDFAKEAPTDEYVDAAMHFEEAGFLDDAWRRWKHTGTDDGFTTPAAEALRRTASQYLKKYRGGVARSE